jgi:hypothetical protein
VTVLASRETRVLALVSISSAVSALDLSLMFVAYPSIRADFPDVPTRGDPHGRAG